LPGKGGKKGGLSVLSGKERGGREKKTLLLLRERGECVYLLGEREKEGRDITGEIPLFPPTAKGTGRDRTLVVKKKKNTSDLLTLPLAEGGKG